VPEPAVAAQVELAGTNPAHRHAHVPQLLAAIDRRHAALEERLDPLRRELLVPGHELLEVGDLERSGHRGLGPEPRRSRRQARHLKELAPRGRCTRP